jgi:hypothetical protein
MADTDARRDALSTWFLEYSVLWGVFPLIDWIVERQTIDRSTLVISLVISLTTGAAGLILKRGDE